jgi:hypothetical protein
LIEHSLTKLKGTIQLINMTTETATKTFDIPKKYKGVVYDKPGTISTKIEELDTPEPGAGEVLVRLLVLLEFLQLGQNGLTKG